MKYWIAVLTVLALNTKVAYSQITISEVMFNPSGSETTDEFIEIYNTSASAISLENWLLVVGTDTLVMDIPPDSVLTSDSWILQSNSFAIIHDSPYWTSGTIYETSVPAGIKRLSATYSLTNSTAKEIQLLTETKILVDSYTYTPVNENGYSDEKILLGEPHSPENWGDSKFEHGTPGQKNSISPLENDLAFITHPAWIPNMVRPGEPFQIQLSIHNSGLNISAASQVNLAIDSNQDSVLSASEIIDSANPTAILPGDSLILDFHLTLSTGSYGFIAEIMYGSDEDTANNVYHWTVQVGYPEMSLLLNEIMYDPYDGDPEWVEILNPGESAINLLHWEFGDASSTKTVLPDFELPAGGMVVLTPDAQLGPYLYNPDSVITVVPFPTLNNSSDGLYLRDMSGYTVDSVYYSSSWGGLNGISLERINPKIEGILEYNWQSSKDSIGATPTSVNSENAPDFDAAFTELYFKKSENSEIELTAQVKNLGQNSLSGGVMTVYYDWNENDIGEQSELIGTVDQIAVPLADSALIQMVLPSFPGGYHQIIANIHFSNDLNFNNNQIIKIYQEIYPANSIIISEIMYRPESGEPEWIEIYVLSDSIDMRGLFIHDTGNRALIHLNERRIFYKDSFLIIGADSSLLQSYTDLEAPVIVISDLPAFNNGSDSVGILNYDGSSIEAVSYTSDWGGEYGKSLERINIYHLSNISQNWGTSIAADGSTPGFINSISENLATRLQVVRIDSNYASSGNAEVEFDFQVHNSTDVLLTDISCQYGFDLNQDGLLESEEIIGVDEFATIPSGTAYPFSVVVNTPGFSGLNTFLILFNNSQIDEIYQTQIWIPYSYQSIMINEIFPDPSMIIQNEFLELVNLTEELINLDGWVLSVNSRPMQIGSNSACGPGSYLLVSSDSSKEFSGDVAVPSKWQSLPNTGGAIVLQDQFNNVVDSLTYSESWNPEPGRSLERLHQKPGDHSLLNWKSSHAIKGATPGLENSLFISQSPEQSAWTFQPRVFSPDGDGMDDIFQIAYTGAAAIQFITIKIYNTEGKLIKTLARDEHAPTPSLWIWDGIREDTRPARIGMYILLIEYETITGESGSLREIAVLAKQL